MKCFKVSIWVYYHRRDKFLEILRLVQHYMITASKKLGFSLYYKFHVSHSTYATYIDFYKLLYQRCTKCIPSAVLQLDHRMAWGLRFSNFPTVWIFPGFREIIFYTEFSIWLIRRNWQIYKSLNIKIRDFCPFLHYEWHIKMMPKSILLQTISFNFTFYFPQEGSMECRGTDRYGTDTSLFCRPK